MYYSKWAKQLPKSVKRLTQAEGAIPYLTFMAQFAIKTLLQVNLMTFPVSASGLCCVTIS